MVDMTGFGLLVGHLLGDYVLQNDWMAANKVKLYHGRDPWLDSGVDPYGPIDKETQQRLAAAYCDWLRRREEWWLGHWACTVHCLLYTLAVWLCACWWLPWWGIVACFAVHWPIDRFKLAYRWMTNVSGQTAFATGSLAPWSVIVVDNTFHLVTLFAVGLVAAFT